MSKFYVILAALVITGLGGYFIHGAFKQARIAGLEQGRKECAAEQNKATGEALKDKESIEDEERKIDDIDTALASLGIMRPDSDR